MQRICIVLLLISCGQQPKEEQDPLLIPYYQSFIFLGFKQTLFIPVTIVFAELPKEVNGRCTRSQSFRKIEISKVKWDKFNEETKEQLMFHELGHCILYRGHNKEMSGDKPSSIMYPYLFSSEKYKLNREYYLKELFKPKENKYD